MVGVRKEANAWHWEWQGKEALSWDYDMERIRRWLGYMPGIYRTRGKRG